MCSFALHRALGYSLLINDYLETETMLAPQPGSLQSQPVT